MGMAMMGIVVVGIVAPAVLVLILARAVHVAAPGPVPAMVISGIGSMVVAAVLVHFLVEPGLVTVSRHWPVLPALPMIQGLALVVLAETLKVWSIRWTLSIAGGLTWRRFAVLAAWTGAGVAVTQTCLPLFMHGDAAQVAASVALAPMHVLSAVVAAWLLWRRMTAAAFGLSIILPALCVALSVSPAMAWWTAAVIGAAVLVPAALALSRPDALDRAVP